MKPCKDCAAAGRPGKPRPAPYPGPRCATHHRARKRALSAAQHASRLGRVYQMTPELYQAILAEQGGVCAGCRRATGRVKRLAVDHDHACCTGCPACWRGLLCSVCNRTLGHFRDDPVRLRALADYLESPPAQRVLRSI